MSAERFRARGRAAKLLLAVSFVPLAVKAASYATLGSYLPLLVFALFAGLVSWGLARGARAEALAVRGWAVAIALWGLVRFGLIGVLTLAPLDEAHVMSQFTPWYVLLSLAHVAAGVWLFRWSAA